MKMIEENKNKLNSQSKYKLSECIDELKWGRPALSQDFIKTLVAMAKRFEKDTPSTFLETDLYS